MSKKIKFFGYGIVGLVLFFEQSFQTLANEDINASQESDFNYSEFNVADLNQEQNFQVVNSIFIYNNEWESVLTSSKKISTGARKVPTKHTCRAKHDRPGWSNEKKKNHMDEDCCADYDEWANPGCAYSIKEMSLMLNGPTSGHKRHK